MMATRVLSLFDGIGETNDGGYERVTNTKILFLHKKKIFSSLNSPKKRDFHTKITLFTHTKHCAYDFKAFLCFKTIVHKHLKIEIKEIISLLRYVGRSST